MPSSLRARRTVAVSTSLAGTIRCELGMDMGRVARARWDVEVSSGGEESSRRGCGRRGARCRGHAVEQTTCSDYHEITLTTGLVGATTTTRGVLVMQQHFGRLALNRSRTISPLLKRLERRPRGRLDPKLCSDRTEKKPDECSRCCCCYIVFISSSYRRLLSHTLRKTTEGDATRRRPCCGCRQ